MLALCIKGLPVKLTCNFLTATLSLFRLYPERWWQAPWMMVWGQRSCPQPPRLLVRSCPSKCMLGNLEKVSTDPQIHTRLKTGEKRQKVEDGTRKNMRGPSGMSRMLFSQACEVPDKSEFGRESWAFQNSAECVQIKQTISCMKKLIKRGGLATYESVYWIWIRLKLILQVPLLFELV